MVAEQILAHEPGKLRDGELVRRFKVLRPAFSAMEAARSLPDEQWHRRVDFSLAPIGYRRKPTVHYGVVASGDKVIADETFVNALKSQWSELAAVEMEGYGTALAAYEAETAPGMILAKALCDWADSNKDDAWHAFAAECSAAYVRTLVSHLRSFTTTGATDRPQAVRLASVSYSGTMKIQFCRRLGPDWEDLADYFDVPASERGCFPKGRECQALWDWLERRKKLDGLPPALDFIGRRDLMSELGSS